MVVLSSSKLTVAVFVASETTTLTTPGTASRLLLTVIGKAEQYIPGAASVTVFSPASAADEVNRLMPRNATPIEKRRDDIECQRAEDEERREHQAYYDDLVQARPGAGPAIRTDRCAGPVD